MAQIGYVRVSSIGQNTSRQLEGVELDEVFEEKVSAKNMQRPKLEECLRFLRKGDVLHVHSIDRLARSLIDLESIVSGLIDRGVEVRFHKENLYFSDENTPMEILLRQILGSFAQFERSLINERRKEGMAAARARGIKFGRPQKLTSDQLKQLKADKAAGTPMKELCAKYGLARSGIYRLLDS